MSESGNLNHHNKAQHHRRHHHRRRHYQRMGIKRGVVYGVAAVAALCTLLILYFGSVGRDDLWPILLRLLPLFVIVGGVVCEGEYYLVMSKYKREFEQ